MTYNIRRARLDDIEDVSRLFDQYRMFYQQTSDIEGAARYIRERLERNESVIWIAEKEAFPGTGKGEKADDTHHNEGSHGNTDSSIQTPLAGFVQLYPSFSSVSMSPIYVLNDLFVHTEYRQQGIARKLLQAAQNRARETRAIRITLSTAISNKQAQVLYESEGYAKDTHFLYYELNL
ncbi:GNAT family N-acetyltransferase [Paenibacillus xylanilyticus]|uniref:GNAT family N-acetyltransferase n=1 Tax=Paenibacillus xylanilyticus TaxID=248903 RepID=UPI0039A01A23